MIVVNSQVFCFCSFSSRLSHLAPRRSALSASLKRCQSRTWVTIFSLADLLLQKWVVPSFSLVINYTVMRVTEMWLSGFLVIFSFSRRGIIGSKQQKRVLMISVAKLLSTEAELTHSSTSHPQTGCATASSATLSTTTKVDMCRFGGWKLVFSFFYFINLCILAHPEAQHIPKVYLVFQFPFSLWLFLSLLFGFHIFLINSYENNWQLMFQPLHEFLSGIN